MGRLLGYTRVSTGGQDARLQVDALVAAGVEDRDIFPDVVSGRRTAKDRPGMRRLLDIVRPGDVVVVWRIDRLGRSLRDLLDTVTLLRDQGVEIRSLSDGIDSTTALGRMQINLLTTLAEYERELNAERVAAGIAAARARGVRLGRPPLDPKVVADKLETALIYRSRGLTAAEAARRVGWTRATFYRHLRAAQHARATDTTAGNATTSSDATVPSGTGRTAASPVAAPVEGGGDRGGGEASNAVAGGASGDVRSVSFDAPTTVLPPVFLAPQARP